LFCWISFPPCLPNKCPFIFQDPTLAFHLLYISSLISWR
jgi:hypothetical protein